MTDDQRDQEGADEAIEEPIEDLAAPVESQADVSGGACQRPSCLATTKECNSFTREEVVRVV
jgi:hypothetical protein